MDQELKNYLQAMEDRLVGRIRDTEQVTGNLTEKTTVLPRLHAAIKELEEASIVNTHHQMLQGEKIKDHREWLAELSAAQAKTEESFQRVAERFEETGKRIDDLVSAVGELIRRTPIQPQQ